MNLVGIKNSLKPTLQAFAELTNNGLCGRAHRAGRCTNPASRIWPAATAICWREIFRRNYPNYSAGLSLNIPLRNRAAQSDYVTSQLELRQNELNLQKEHQPGTGGRAERGDRLATGSRSLRCRQPSRASCSKQTLAGDQGEMSLGAATVFQVVQDQRDLATAESTEMQAMANYTHARIAFDQALGTTLEVNHISLDEALAGQLARPSELPANLPAECAREASHDDTQMRSRYPACSPGLAHLGAGQPAHRAGAAAGARHHPSVFAGHRSAGASREFPAPSANWFAPGHLYLTAQDAIALALENNIDIEVSALQSVHQRLAARALRGGRRFAGRAEQRLAGRIGRYRPGRRRKPGRRWGKRAGRERQRQQKLERDYFADRSGHSEPRPDTAGDHHVEPHQYAAARPGAKPGAQPDTEHARI